FLGEDVQPGEQAERLIKVKVVDMTAPLLIEELERQEGQERTGGRDHSRARVAGCGDDLIEAQLGQQWQEEKDTGHARLEPTWWHQAQKLLIRDGGHVGAVSIFAAPLARWSATAVEHKKGGF